jgi:hypothetical protein
MIYLVRATGSYRINDFSRPEGDQTLVVRAGDLVPADHWAVLQHQRDEQRSGDSSGWFVPTDATPTGV